MRWVKARQRAGDENVSTHMKKDAVHTQHICSRKRPAGLWLWGLYLLSQGRGKAGLRGLPWWATPTLSWPEPPAAPEKTWGVHRLACLSQTCIILIKHGCMCTCSVCRGPIQPPGRMWWSPWQECKDQGHLYRSVEPQGCPAGSSPPSSTTYTWIHSYN